MPVSIGRISLQRYVMGHAMVAARCVELPMPAQRRCADLVSRSKHVGADEVGKLVDEALAGFACRDVTGVKLDDAVVGEGQAQGE